jgi:hypothetical protein
VSPARKIVSTLLSPLIEDLILIGGATPLVRVRAPPETWTTRHWPYDLPEATLVDEIFRLVINFGNECSKFEQFAKSLRNSSFHAHLHAPTCTENAKRGINVNF